MNALNTLTSWLHPATPPTRPAATTTAERRKTLADIAAERERFAAACARDAEHRATASAEVCQAEIRLADAQRRRAEIETAALGRSLTHSLRISALEAHLRSGAAPCLGRFLSDLAALVDETRLQSEVLKADAGARDDFTGALSAPAIATNAASVGRRLRAIDAARVRVVALTLEPEADEEVLRATLRELLAGLPAVEPALREAGPVHSAAELREVEWRRGEAR
jgi:hypothetical protein